MHFGVKHCSSVGQSCDALLSAVNHNIYRDGWKGSKTAVPSK